MDKKYNSLFNINKNKCLFYLKKNGKIIYYPTYKYNNYLCILNNRINILLQYFPVLDDVDENAIVKKLLILKFLQKNDIKYIIFKKNIFKNNDYIYTFKETNIDKIITYLYYIDIVFTNKIQNTIIESDEKYLAYFYILNKLIYTEILNENNFIKLFYENYIYLIDDKIKEKYNVSIKNFPNYHELYLFLKKNGYVDYYYKKMVKKILKISKDLEKKLLTKHDIKFETFRDKKLKTIKNYKDINLINLLDTHLNEKFDKTYIKNKFIELCKKYNI